MTVQTSRFTSALATLVAALAAYVIARYAVDDQALAALIAAVSSAVTGLLVPAAAAPVGTVDALTARTDDLP